MGEGGQDLLVEAEERGERERREGEREESGEGREMEWREVDNGERAPLPSSPLSHARTPAHPIKTDMLK